MDSFYLFKFYSLNYFDELNFSGELNNFSGELNFFNKFNLSEGELNLFD